MVRDCVQYETPFSREEIVHQADIWFNKIVTIRPSISRNLPPSEKYVKSKGAKDDTYTLWGWDRKCDLIYVQAIWELGLNQIVRTKSLRISKYVAASLFILLLTLDPGQIGRC
jgi:hypothetical protein